MKESFSGDGKPASSIEAAFARVDLLVLDEVGVQYGSKAELVMLTELIDERYSAKRPTIVVSNLGSAELIDMVGERAADRLAEHGVDLLFDWPSFRRRKPEPNA
jgi:DNA replication protein DnaC